MIYRYRHTGPCGRIHTGLSVGTWIVLRVDPAEPRRIPVGSTVLLEPGDVLVTSAEYEHPELVLVEEERVTKPDVDPRARRAPAAPPATSPVPTQADPVD